jgi:MFS family permease
MAHARESKDAVIDVFRNPSLRRLNLALAGSVIGDWAQGVAFSVYVYQRGGATLVGAFAVVRYLSAAVLGPLVAVLADKFDRRRLMISSDLVRFLLALCGAALIFTGAPTLAVFALYLLTVIGGLVFRPAQSSLLPSLATSPGELTAANATSLTIHSLAFFVGPAIAGVLLALTDAGWVFVFNALTFLWSSYMVFGIHPPKDVDPPAPADAPSAAADAGNDGHGGGGMFAGVGDGYRTIFGSRHLRLLVLLYVAQTIVAGASAVYEVAIALDLLDLGESGLGLLGVGLGVGGVAGGALALLMAQRGRLARDFGVGVILWAAPLLLVSAWPSVVTALVAMAAIGLGNSVVDVNAETIIQRLAPDEVMGRVFGALDSAAVGGMAVGSLLMPVLINTVGLRWGIAVIGVVVPLVVLLSARGLTAIDRIALAPEGLDLLRGVPMLAVLPESLIERLARTSTLVRIAAGTNVFEQGDHGDRFYVVEQGALDVRIDGVLVNRAGPGESFGELALLRDAPRAATVTATADVVLRAIDRRHFLPAVTGHTEANEQALLVVGRFAD